MDQIYAPAEFNMGVMYATATGLPRDLVQAVEWYRKAAESGLPQARDALRKNATEANEWFRRAAEKGVREAPSKPDNVDAPAVLPK